MTDEQLTPERAIRLLHAKAAELEQQVLNDGAAGTVSRITYLAADMALVMTLLMQHIERSLPSPEVTEAMKQFREGFDEGRPTT